MKKYFKRFFIFFAILFFSVNFAYTKPFISTIPTPRVEYYRIITEDNLTKETFEKIVFPQENDTLVVDVVNELGIKEKNGSFKITLIASNSAGDSQTSVFNLDISKEGDLLNYKIIPLEEPNNPDYMKKYDQESLEVVMKDNNNNDDNNNSGCFLKTLM